MTKISGTRYPNARKYPEGNLRALVKMAAMLIVVIICLSTVAYYYVLSRNIRVNAESQAVRISQALIVELRPLLFQPVLGGSTALKISNDGIPGLDRRLREFLRPFSISKIKIYDIEGKIIYSTDRKIIGRVDVANKRLENALAGKNDSHIETKDKMLDLEDEQVFDADFVETYVPIRNELGKVVGCFELYEDVTRYRQELWKNVTISSMILAFSVVAVFAFSYLLIRRGTNRPG